MKENTPMIIVQNLNQSYHNQPILTDIHFNVNQGDVIGLMGPSGSGKSVLLRALHGFDKTDGTIIKQGTSGLIFQQFHLFPHMNVLDNLIYAPIKVLKLSKKQAIERAQVLLERMKLWEKRMDFPAHLSGGQKQRVAIIRALLMGPSILLFDEPTSALDPTLVQEVVKIIEELKQQNLTLIIASHELSFLQKVANRILFLEKGKIIYNQDTASFFKRKDIQFLS